MRKSVVWVISIFLIFLVVYGAYLVIRLTKTTSSGITDINKPRIFTLAGDTPSGEAVVSENFKLAIVPYDRVTIYRVWVEDFKYYSNENNENDKLDIELGYKIGSEEKSFKVTAVEKVFYSEFVKENDQLVSKDKGVVDVSSVNLNKGEWVSLGLAYFPTSVVNIRRGFSNYCREHSDDYLCNGYQKLGFGDKQIDAPSLEPENIPDGTVFPTSQVAIWYLSRNLVEAKVNL